MKVPAAATTTNSVVRANLSLNLCHRDFYKVMKNLSVLRPTIPRASATHLGSSNGSRLDLGCSIRRRDGRDGSVRTLGEEGSACGDRLSRTDGSSGEGGGGDCSEECRGRGDASREGACEWEERDELEIH
jgi:hypothetical protein